MLNIVDKDGVEDPVEPDHDIQNHCNVVYPHAMESKHLTQEWMLGIGITQAPVHNQIPHGCVSSVEKRESNERSLETCLLVNAIHAECRIVKDTTDVLGQIEKVREGIPGVYVSTDTLERSQYRREAGEKSEEPRMARVAMWRIVPIRGVKAKEEFKILSPS